MTRDLWSDEACGLVAEKDLVVRNFIAVESGTRNLSIPSLSRIRTRSSTIKDGNLFLFLVSLVVCISEGFWEAVMDLFIQKLHILGSTFSNFMDTLATCDGLDGDLDY